MSGPSATEKPISAKIAVSSSITWLIGWMRPRVSGASGTGSVTSMRSAASRASRAASASASFRAAIARLHLVAQAVDERAALLALLRRHGAEGLQEFGDGALLAERGDAHGFEGRFVAGGVDLGEQVTFELVEIGHRSLARMQALE